MTAPSLPKAFLRHPVAHRALHDLSSGLPENSREAVLAAVAQGYAIEIDLQLSSDGAAMVFHDYDLDRLTDETGPLFARTEEELRAIPLAGGETGIPAFGDILALVAGRVPLLVELKDQSGTAGLGPLEAAAAFAAAGYEGPLAFMSFNPDSVALMADLSPDVPRGLTTCGYEDREFDSLPRARREELREIADFDRVGASFISHDHHDLNRARITQLKGAGVPILCWTIRSPEDETRARVIADNVTFEGYPALIPA